MTKNRSNLGIVAPVRERGLKFGGLVGTAVSALGRSRKGAWIEIRLQRPEYLGGSCRSRKGAWIEISKINRNRLDSESLP